MEDHGKYGQFVWTHDKGVKAEDDALYVNLFVAHLFSDEEHFLEMEVDFLQPFLDIEARTARANPGKVAMT